MSLAQFVKCPACGKDDIKLKGLAIHTRLHCPSKKSKKVDKLPKCDCEVGTWAMLSGSMYGNCMQHVNEETGKNYKQYCTVCREVY